MEKKTPCNKDGIKDKLLPNCLHKPKLIRMGISRSCNFRCLMCWSYSPFSREQKKDEWKKVKIDKDFACRIIEEASDIGFKNVLFSGCGEPFTHPAMIDFVAESARRKMGVVIQTNLSLVSPTKLVRALEGIKEKSIICVNVSASSAGTYKEIHGNVGKNDFNDILNKIDFLLKYHIKVRVVYIVIKSNRREIEKIIKLNKEIGSFLHLELADFVPGGGVENVVLGRQERMTLAKNLSYLWGKDRETNSNISDFIAQIKYQGIGTRKIKQCLIGYNFCAVNEVGRIYYCFNSNADFFMGDLNNSSLKKIWFSHKYNIMRKRLERGNFLEKCKNYCINSGRFGNYRGSNFKIRFYIDPSLPLPLA